MKIYNNVLELVGNTPLVRLKKIVEGARGQVVVKLESRNPLSSVKDRIGLSMIEDGETQGMKGAIEKAKEIAAATANSYIPQQFENQANPEVHRRTTAEEIWKDTDGKVDVLVAGVGHGGTTTGGGGG